MAVRVRLFAAARQAVGSAELAVPAAPVRELLADLVAEHGAAVERLLPVCTVLVDGRAVAHGSSVMVADGAELAILPPVSGGAGGPWPGPPPATTPLAAPPTASTSVPAGRSPAGGDGVVEDWERRPAEVTIARALGSATRARIYDRLRVAEHGVSVRDVADGFGLHPNVARTHLEVLADAGLVAVGLRRRPVGGRPAKVYRALDEAPTAVTHDHGAGLLVELLAGLADAVADAPVDLAVVAAEVGQLEGRRLALAAVSGATVRRPTDLAGAARTVVAALAERAPGTRLLRVEDEVVELTPPAGALTALRERRPRVAEALERGLVSGALGALIGPVEVEATSRLRDGSSVYRVTRLSRAGDARDALTRLDVRGVRRDTGVATVMRATAGLEVGALVEVIADGPGSPARFARWIDRAGHELLVVERMEDAAGRGIRMLIRKGG